MLLPQLRGTMRRTSTTTSHDSPSIALVKEALKAKGMRQQELADLTGLSKDHVSRILLGKVAFPKSRDTLNALAAALDLDPLQFSEYRRQLAVLPESTRRLVAHLKQKGLTQQQWIKRIPAYSEGHLQLILRGGSPFPKDPETIELFAEAAEASPFLFAEYLPLADWHGRVLEAAKQALDPADMGVFVHLWGKIERHFVAAYTSEGEERFEERLLKHFQARHFGGHRSGEDPELDDALTYLPPIEHYQSEVKAVLEALYERGMSVAELSAAIEEDEDNLFAVLNGQMKLKDGFLKRKLFNVLELQA